MDYSNIVSENFQNFQEIASREKLNYQKAKPFPNIALKNFFKDDFLNTVLKEFPDLSTLSKSQSYVEKNEIKLSNNKYNTFSPTIKLFIDFLNSENFLSFIPLVIKIVSGLVEIPETPERPFGKINNCE